MRNKMTKHIVITVSVFLCVFMGIVSIATVLNSYDEIRYQGATFNGLIESLNRVLNDAETYRSLSYTLYLTLKGFFVGCIFAVLIVFVLGSFPEYVGWVMPIFSSMRAIPMTLLVPVLVALPKVFVLPPGSDLRNPSRDPFYLISIGTFLYVIIGFAEGVSNIDKERINIGKKIFKFDRMKNLWNIVFFDALPYILSSVRMALLFAFVLAIVLEQLVQYPGIGLLISNNLANSGSVGNGMTEADALVQIFIVAITGIIIDVFYLFLKNMLISKGILALPNHKIEIR